MPPARKALLPPSHPTSRGSFRRKYPPYWSDSRARRLPPIPAHLPGERRQLPFPWPSLTIPATCHFNLFLNRRFKDQPSKHRENVAAKTFDFFEEGSIKSHRRTDRRCISERTAA